MRTTFRRVFLPGQKKNLYRKVIGIENENVNKC